MSVSITLSFNWPMGHRILGLDGAGAKCRNVHGHNWVAEIELPNDSGKLEFGAVKSAVGEWIETYLDHGFILDLADPFTEYLSAEDMKFWSLDGPPTTEAIAKLLSDKTEELVGVKPLRVYVREGFRNAATWSRS